MAVRFTNEHTSWAASSPIVWKIEIHDSAFGGASTDFEVAAGAELRYQGAGDNIFSPILASSLSFDMQIQGSTHEALITSMAGAAEGRFTVVLYKDTVFHWAGVVNSPEISIEDWDFPYTFRITAVDGIALLKSYEYRQDGTSATKYDLRYTGIDTLTDIVLRCLKKLPHVVTHFTGSTKFLVTAINWYETQHDATPVADTYDPFYYTELDNRFSVIGQSSGNAKFLSCYDVLAQILTAFNARMGLFDGYFLAEQIEHRAYTIGSNDNYSRYYAYDGTGPTANTLTADQDVGQSQTIKKLRGGSYSFLQAARSCRVKQTVNSLSNLLAGSYFDSGTVETATVTDVFGDGNSSYIRLTGGLEWSLENLGVASPGTTPFIARFRIKLQLDSLYASRTVAYDTGGNWTYSQLTWEVALSYIEIPVKLTIPGINDTWTGQTAVDIMFPLDSTFAQGDLVVSVEFIEINYYILGAETLLDPSDYTLDWTFRDPYCAVIYSPKKIKTLGLTPGAVNPKSATYEVIGTASNTETIDIETLLGDRIGTVLNQWGGFLFNDAGDYSYTSAWGARNGTRNRTIAQLLAKRIVDFLYYPKRTYRGTAVGSPISIQVPITDQTTSDTCLLQSGTYYTHRDELAGEWVDISFVAPELTYAPVEYDTGEYEKTTAGGGGSGGSGGGPDNGGNGAGAGSGGDGIYGGSGTVADGTVATMADDFEFSGGDTSSLAITTGTTTGGQIFSDFNGASIIYRDSGGSNSVTASSGGIGITLSGSVGDKLLVSGLTDIEHSGTDSALTVLNTTSATNAAQSVLLLQANSSGTADAGFGPAILLQAESSTTNDQDAAKIQSVWSTATHASRTADLVFLLTYNAAALAEHFRIVGASTPVVKIGGGTTTFGNAAITTGASFVVGGSSNTLTLGNSSGTTRLGNSSGSVEIIRNTSVTNTGVPFYIDANTTGTPANGLGPQLVLRGETSTSTSQNMAYIQAAWTDVTHASRTSDILFSVVRNATIAEKAKFVSSGDFGLKKNDVGTTQDTVSITAYGSESNLSFAIIPKGTGALTLQVPDGATTGGAARGTDAVDLQKERNASTQVASGTRSFVGGGRRNTASGTYSATLGGSSCVASGNGSVCLGGDGSFGVGNSATGTNSFAFGVGADATANSAIAFLADASATQSFAVHRNATHQGEFAMMSHSFLILSEQTLGTGNQELFLDGNGGTLRATIPSGKVWNAQVFVCAKISVVGNGTGLTAGDIYAAQYGVVIHNLAGTTALVGTVQTIMAAQSAASMAGAAFTIAADDTNDALTVTYVPGPNEGTTTQTSVYATIQLSEF